MALVPAIYICLASGRYGYALTLFIIAGLSDALDGYLAKRWSMQSELGAYLDPLADKLLLVSVFAAMLATGAIAPWVVALIIGRDILIVGAVGVSWTIGKPIAIQPLFISKATTTAQIALAALLLAKSGLGIGAATLIDLVTWTTVGLTLASLVAYFRAWRDHLSLRTAPEPTYTDTHTTSVGRHGVGPYAADGLRSSRLSDFDVGVRTTRKSSGTRL